MALLQRSASGPGFVYACRSEAWLRWSADNVPNGVNGDHCRRDRRFRMDSGSFERERKAAQPSTKGPISGAWMVGEPQLFLQRR